LAAEVAVLGRLLVLSGGPGTGKTTTVVRLAALLLGQMLGTGRPRPELLLLAPTGKAAARLGEAVKQAKGGIDTDPAVRELITEEASTIHRALGPIGRSGHRFRRGLERPLTADVVVVDEASMVDVALMRHLLDAVRPEAHLVIVGDPDQLSSVEAGAVLADITQGPRDGYSQSLARRYRQVFGAALPGEMVADRPQGLSDSVVRLEKSYRFATESAIGRLTTAIRSGNAEEALQCLDPSGKGGAVLVETRSHTADGPALSALSTQGFAPAMSAADAATALARLERFRVLCAHRGGPDGVETINVFIERALERAGRLRLSGAYYPGRPLLITENDYELGLFNGDVGIVWRESMHALPRAYFRMPGGGLRAVASSRLPAHETAFAMSIHKSQGSEFDDVAVLLPDATSPLLSRELVYTAVSRARRKVTLFAKRDDLAVAITRRVERDSGLKDLLAPGA
jgi:exodeoxyribonuclease V alpha subunit